MSPRRNKYNAQKTVVDGITFDSKKEARRYGKLRLLQRDGVISHLELQPKIMLVSGTTPVRGESGRQLFYRADFRYFDIKLDRRVIEDCKGFKTKEYLLKKAFVKAMWPGVEVLET